MDSRVKEILDFLKVNKTRDDIAEFLGHRDHRTIDQYMRRRHYVWNEEQKTYVMSPVHPRYASHSSHHSPTPSRVAQVVSQFGRVTADPKEIVGRLRFADYKEMAQYMQSKGYIWSSKSHNR
jgi:hypothetical protein